MRLSSIPRDSLKLHALGFLGANFVLAALFVASGAFAPWLHGPTPATLCAFAGAALLYLAARGLAQRA